MLVYQRVNTQNIAACLPLALGMSPFPAMGSHWAGCQHHGGTYHAKFPGLEGDSDQALPDGASRRLPSGAVVLIALSG